ncbi:MAG: response regulator [Vicinamibacterales bacterium]|nr:response regulator [Vicinamibacterales bacterium]
MSDKIINLTDQGSEEDPQTAMRDARQRFIAAFPRRADSIGLLLNTVTTMGVKGPVGPLREIVHRTAGLAGTLGFPTVSARARDLEELLDQADRQALDGSQANRVFDALRDGFTEDLTAPPAWAFTTPVLNRSRRIMVVEDDEDQREVVSIHLRAAGFTVLPVAEGDKVVDAALQLRPDLILLDANLPGLDGYSVCRLLKADPALAGTPVIFTTVRAKVDDKAVGLLLGADEYLTKPLDLNEVVLRVTILLDRKNRKETLPSDEWTATCWDAKDLDYESFVVVAREQLARSPAVLALVKVPESRLVEVLTALRADLRRRDVVACYDPAHLILLMADMPAGKAADRLADIVANFGPGSLPRFHVGLAASDGPGTRPFETLLAEADQAVASARRRGVVTAIAGDEPVEEPPAGLSKGKIVLADDDPEVTRLIDAQFKAAGYQTFLALDGAQAISAIETHLPDVVIVDMMMPRMTGFDVLSRVRHMPVRPRIMVLSVRGHEQDVTRAFALGADDYVTKPFSPQELLARVERLIR